ncbi:transcriptional activator domain-containing protein [Candidatus Magnetoovum chiemensis]|nr:transcriptional activator domain-containing protein [Candidatus Magnetoovum chiemensis]
MSIENSSVENLMDILNNSDNIRRFLFDYFLEEIYKELPDYLRAFMKLTSLPNMFNAKLYTVVTNNEYAGYIDILLKKELFIVKLDEEGQWYKYHQIMQEFLRQRLSDTKDTSYIETLHKKLAAYFSENNDWQNTIYHSIRAKDYDKLSEVLLVLGSHSFEAKFSELVLQWLNDIPEEIINLNCSLLYIKGWAQGQIGNLNNSIKLLNLAKDIAKQQNNLNVLYLSIFCLANSYFQNEQLYMYTSLNEEICEDLYKNNKYFFFLKVYISNSMIYYLNNPALFKPFYDAVFAMDDINKNDPAYNFIAMCSIYHYDCFMGNIDEAITKSSNYLPVYEERLDTNSFIYIFYAHILFEAGNYLKSSHFIKLPLEAFYRFGNLFFIRDILGLYAINELHLNNIDEARRAVEKIKEVNKIGKKWENTRKNNVSTAFALLSFYENDSEAFCYWADDAINYVGKLNSYYLIYQVHCELAPCYAKLGNTDKAIELLETSIRVINDFGNLYGEARSRLILASILYDKGLYGAALEHLSKAVEVSVVKGYDFLFMQKEKHHTIKLLPFMLENKINLHFLVNISVAIGKEIGSGTMALLGHNDMEVKSAAVKILCDIKYRQAKNKIEEILLKDMNNNARQTIEQAAKIFELLPPEPLTVNCFGSFRLSIGDRQIQPRDWKRKSAKTICKYFIFQSSKEIITDKLIDTFWQNDDAVSGRKNLLMAVSALRKLIEPDILPKKASSYIKFADGMYSFFIPDGSYIDAFEFESCISNAVKYSEEHNNIEAECYYKRAVELYKADFLEEDLYEDWTYPLRDKYLSMYIKALKELSNVNYKNQDYTRTIEYLNKIIQKDKYDEQAYYLLMKTYIAEGNRNKAITEYKKYYNFLKAEQRFRKNKL